MTTSCNGGGSQAAALRNHIQVLTRIKLTGSSYLGIPRHETGASHDNRVGEAEGSQTLVRLNSHSAGLPVFFYHPIGGNPMVFRPLVQALELTRPAYGARAPELDWKQDVLNFREMTNYYFTELRRAQPNGPYSIVGYSFGVYLAFELASRLVADGQEVRHLVLLDAAPDSLSRRLCAGLRPRSAGPS